MPDDEGLLTLDEFQEKVGASADSVRVALRVLRKEPVPNLSDRRKKRYRSEWVSEVRQWIQENIQHIA